jgi:hypothetical protein
VSLGAVDKGLALPDNALISIFITQLKEKIMNLDNRYDHHLGMRLIVLFAVDHYSTPKEQTGQTSIRPGCKKELPKQEIVY